MENQVRVDGRQTFWKLCDHFNREALLAGLKPLGWHRHCPQPRSESSALREALEELVKAWKLKNVLVRPLDDVNVDGYAVVHEEPGESRNEYDTLFTARWVQPSSSVSPYAECINGSHQVDSTTIDQWFQHYRKLLTSHAVAKMLRIVITDHLRGISLRPSGGFYWLPADSLPVFQQVIDTVYSAAVAPDRCKIYLPGFNLTDVGAVEAVRDAIVEDIHRRTELIVEQAGRPGAKKRALSARNKDAAELHIRVKAYEKYLGELLPELHKAADDCQREVVSTTLEQFPDFFAPVSTRSSDNVVTANTVDPFSAG